MIKPDLSAETGQPGKIKTKGTATEKGIAVRIYGHMIQSAEQMTKNEKGSLPVTSTKETRFLVHVADGTKITTDDFEIGILSNIVLGHFEHTKMQIGDWTEGATCYKHYRRFVGVVKDGRETMMRKSVSLGVRECFSEMSVGHGKRRRKGKKRGRR